MLKQGGPTNQSFTTRNLHPRDLGAVIFGCTNNTIAECHSRQLFGLPKAHISYVRNIKEGLPLFLFNYDDRKLHGIYEATSDGKFCPQSNAWSHNGKEKTGYPAQVAMRVRVWCFPLEESQFRNSILTNYYQRMPGIPVQKLHLFQFELDHAQTHALMHMFTPLPSPSNFLTPRVAAPGHGHVKKLVSPPVWAPEYDGTNDLIKSKKVVKKNKLKEVGTGGVNSERASSSNKSSNSSDDLGSKRREYASLNNEAKVQRQQSGQQDKEMGNTCQTAVNKLSPPLPAIAHQLQATKRQQTQVVYQTPNNNNANSASAAPSQEPVRDDGSLCKGIKRKTITQDIQRSPNDNSLCKGRKKRKAKTPVIQRNHQAMLAQDSPMGNTCQTAVNKLSPPSPAIAQQFQATERQQTQVVYQTPNNNTANRASAAPSQEPVRDDGSLCNGIQLKEITQDIQRNPNDNSLCKGRKRRKAKTRAIQRNHQAMIAQDSPMGNTCQTVVNKLSPPPPAVAHQFQATERQQTQVVYQTPNNNNANSASAAPSQEPVRDDGLCKGIKLKAITQDIQRSPNDNSLCKRRKKRKAKTRAIQRNHQAMLAQDSSMGNICQTAVNKLSPSPPAIAHQFQATERQQTQVVCQTPSNNDVNIASAAPSQEPVRDDGSLCKGIKPAITHQFQATERQQSQVVYQTPNNNDANRASAAPSQEPVRDDGSLCKGIKRKAITQEIQRSPNDNSLCKGRKKRKAMTPAIQRNQNDEHEIVNTHQTEMPSPDYVKDRLAGNTTCKVCGEEGHYTFECPMKDQVKKVICTLCNKAGHCHLWCCRQNVSEKHACQRCGEKGHYANSDLNSFGEKYTYNGDLSCSSCDTNHPFGKCPMSKITCFLCEGKDHVPVQCRLSPILTAVTQYHQENFRATMKQAITETSRRAVALVKLSEESEPHNESPECQFNRDSGMVPKLTDFSSSKQGCCERKSPVRSLVPCSHNSNHATPTDKALTQISRNTCFSCHAEGHYAYRCPNKELPGELEMYDVTCSSFHANRCHKKKKKKPEELELCFVTCFKCDDKGHYSYNCPKNKLPNELEPYDGAHECHYKGDSETITKVSSLNHGKQGQCDRKSPIRTQVPDPEKTNPEAITDGRQTKVLKVPCLNCHEEGHHAKRCPKKVAPKKLDPCDVTCFHCNDGHYTIRCPKKKKSRELELSGVTCFNCHDKGHYGKYCPKKNIPGTLEPYDDSHGCQFKGHSEMVPEVSRFSCGEQDPCDRKSPIRTLVSVCHKTNPAATMDGADSRTQASRRICYNCRDIGHYANKCPNNKLNTEHQE